MLQGKVATIKFLIGAGANINMQDADGQTVLHKAVENKKFELVDFLLKASPQLTHIKDFKGCLALKPQSNLDC